MQYPLALILVLRDVGDCGSGESGDLRGADGTGVIGDLSGAMAVGVVGDLMERDSIGLLAVVVAVECGIGETLSESFGLMALEANILMMDKVLSSRILTGQRQLRR